MGYLCKLHCGSKSSNSLSGRYSMLMFGKDLLNIYDTHASECMYTQVHVQEADCSQSLGYETLIKKYSWDQHLEGKRRRQEAEEEEFRLQCRPSGRDPMGIAGIRVTFRVVPNWAKMGRSLCPHLIALLDCKPPRKGYDLV